MFFQFQRLYPHDAESLIVEVAEKACDVILWVRLAVSSLLEELRDGNSIADLKERFLMIPSDLEAVFWKILNNLE
jgi:hypothetical protein